MKDKKDIIVTIQIVVILILCIIIVIKYTNKNRETSEMEGVITEQTVAINNTNSFYVDLKGAVKNPGVYKVDDGMIINDLIKLGGGLKSNASTKNINLSEKLKDSMVVYIFTKSELTTTVPKEDATCKTNVIEVNNCINKESEGEKVDSNKTEQTKSNLVNINTASKEELMSVSGIGESKADSIIIYRNKTPFTKIEDVMNVTGIGESLYDKIKNYITV